MKKLLVLIAFILSSSLIQAAGTATVTFATPVPGYATYSIAWTSTAGGAVSANSFTIRPGRIVQIEFAPGAGGVQPTDLYDVTLVDSRSIDYLAGSGANLSNATSTVVSKDPALITAGATLDLVVANAGNAKSGTVTIWVAQ